MARMLVAVLSVATLALLDAPVARACNTKVVWQADLTGAGFTPAVRTSATGKAVFQFNFHNDIGTPDATVIVDLSNVKGVTGIDLRAGDRDKPGPILFSLYSRKDGRRSPNHFSKTITEADLHRQTDPRIQTFVDVVNAVTGHTAFITVSTRANAAGELRGEITMRKIAIYSAEDTGAGHNAQLHEQAASAARPAPGRP